MGIVVLKVNFALLVGAFAKKTELFFLLRRFTLSFPLPGRSSGPKKNKNAAENPIRGLSGCDAYLALGGANAYNHRNMGLALRHIFVAAALSVTFVGCKKKAKSIERSVDSKLLMPEGITFLAHINVAALMGSKAYGTHREQLEHSEVGASLAQFRQCKLGPEAFRSAEIGADAQGGYVVILRGEGVGDPSRWECLAKAERPSSSATLSWSPFEVRKEGQNSELRPLSGGESRGFLVDDHTVVFASPAWTRRVEQRRQGKIPAAVETTLRVAYTKAPTHLHAWFSGTLPARFQAKIDHVTPPPGSGLSAISGGLRVSGGVELQLEGVFFSEKQARLAQQQLSHWLVHLRGYSPMFGLPKTALQTAKVHATGKTVSLGAQIGEQEWSDLQQNLSKISAGAKDAPRIPDIYPRDPGSKRLDLERLRAP